MKGFSTKREVTDDVIAYCKEALGSYDMLSVALQDLVSRTPVVYLPDELAETPLSHIRWGCGPAEPPEDEPENFILQFLRASPMNVALFRGPGNYLQTDYEAMRKRRIDMPALDGLSPGNAYLFANTDDLDGLAPGTAYMFPDDPEWERLCELRGQGSSPVVGCLASWSANPLKSSSSSASLSPDAVQELVRSIQYLVFDAFDDETAVIFDCTGDVTSQ